MKPSAQIFAIHRSREHWKDFAANAGAQETVVICAANSRPFTGEEWEQITPWGDFPNPAGLQRLNRVTGQRMVDAFNSFVGKAKHTISPVPIYSGHPDVDPEHYKDDRRYGKIEALEARDDGLWCKPAYNDLGKQNKEQGYWVYPSGVWKFKRMPGGVIEPFELLSVGLTNVPVIKSVQPWTRNAERRAANAGTRESALKGWATRRANGTAGANNPRAVKVLATLGAKKAGRKATADDKAKAGEKLRSSSKVSHQEKAIMPKDFDHQLAAHKAGKLERTDDGKAIWRSTGKGSRTKGATSSVSGAYVMKHLGAGSYSLHHKDATGPSIATGSKAQLYRAAEKHEAGATPLKISAPKATAGENVEHVPSPSQKATNKDDFSLASKVQRLSHAAAAQDDAIAKHGYGSPEHLEANKERFQAEQAVAAHAPSHAQTQMARVDAKTVAAPKPGRATVTPAEHEFMQSTAKAAVAPPPAPKSTSSSSGGGTHVHIHVGSDTPATPAKKGLFSSILEAFSKPHAHDGGAVNSLYFDDFYGRGRRVAINGRRNKTAAARANA